MSVDICSKARQTDTMTTSTLATFLLVLAAASFSAEGVVFCYYGSWATYRPFPAKFDVETIDTSLCTHVVYTFAGLDTTTGKITSLDSWNDINLGSFEKFTALEGVVPLLGVGGWNEGSLKYSQMAATSVTRRMFASSVVAFLQQYGFQGLDLVWMYPGLRDGLPQDRANYVLLLQELSTQLKAAGLLLTIGAGASYDMLETSYDVNGFKGYVDYVNLLAFDYHSYVDQVTAFHAPLYAQPLDNRPLNVNQSVNMWLTAGLPKTKLVLGIPSHARSYTLANTANNVVGVATSGPGVSGPYTLEAGLLAYYEVCINPWTYKTVDGNVYGVSGDQWASVQTPESIAIKTAYIKQLGLAGAFINALESDDFNDLCSGGANPLLTAINAGLK